MDILSFSGLFLAVLAIVGGNFIEGGRLTALLNLPAFMIVIGGTCGAALLQTQFSVLRRTAMVLVWVFTPPVLSSGIALEKVLSWSNTARREGLLGLETVSDTEPDKFVRTGLQMLVDGNEPAAIRDVLETEIFTRQDIDMAAAGVFEAMGGYAPTIGILGAVMGLIHVMSHLAEPSRLGSGIATAFVATIYGVGSANLIFLPIAAKIKSNVLRQSQMKQMIMEGLIAIADGENPRNIELRLQSFVDAEGG